MNNNVYLVEIKLGNAKIRRYVLNTTTLEQIMQENPEYEYVKLVEDKPKIKKRVKKQIWHKIGSMLYLIWQLFNCSA